MVLSCTRSMVLTYYSYYPEEQAHQRLSLLFCGTGPVTETDCHTHTGLVPEKLSPQPQFTLSRWGRAGTRTQRARPGSQDGGVGVEELAIDLTPGCRVGLWAALFCRGRDRRAPGFWVPRVLGSGRCVYIRMGAKEGWVLKAAN